MTESNWLLDFAYKPIKGGRQDGILAFHLTFGAPTDPVNIEYAALIQRILAYKNKNKQSRAVVLNGYFSPATSIQMLTFVKALTDSGFKIQVVSNGQLYFDWFGLVNWLIVENDGSLWSGFKCNEFRYLLPDGDAEIFDPILPPELSNATLYLSPTKKTDPKTLWKYIITSAYNWALLKATK